MSITQANLFTQADVSLLSFIGLVGCAYLNKTRDENAFLGETPESYLNSFLDTIFTRTTQTMA